MVHDRRKNDNWERVLNNVESSLDRKIVSLDEEDIATFDSDDDEGTAIVRGDKDASVEQSAPFTARTMTIVVTSVLLSVILLGLLLVLLRGS